MKKKDTKNYKIGALKRKLNIKADEKLKPGMMISRMNTLNASRKKKVAFMGLV